MLGATRLAFRVWTRETSALLGLSPRVLQAIGIVLGLLGVLIVIGSVQLFDEVTDLANEASLVDVGVVTRSLSHGVVLSAAVVGGIFGLLTGDLSAMDTLLHLAGADRRKRLAVLVLPTLTVALAITWIATSPLVYVLSAFGSTPWVVLSVLAIGMLSVTVAAVAALAGHRLVAKLCRERLRLPLMHANVAAFVVIVALTLLMSWPAFSPTADSLLIWTVSPGGVTHLIIGGLLDLPDGHLAGGLALLIIPILAAAGLLLASAPSARNVGDQTSGLVYTIVRAPARGDLPLLVWYEAVSLARAPTTLMSFFGVVAASLGTVFWDGTTIGDLSFLLLGAIAGAVGLHTTGTNLRASWLLRCSLGTSWRLGAAKILGGLLVVLLLFGIGGVGPAIVIGPSTLATVLFQITLPTFFGSLLAGSLVPVDGQQPLTSAMAGAVTLLISGGGLLLLTRLFGLIGDGYAVAAVPVFMLLSAASVIGVLSHLHSESVVRRS